MAEPLKIIVTCSTCPFSHPDKYEACADHDCTHPEAPREPWIDGYIPDAEVMPWCPLKTRPVLVALA